MEIKTTKILYESKRTNEMNVFKMRSRETITKISQYEKIDYFS